MPPDSLRKHHHNGLGMLLPELVVWSVDVELALWQDYVEEICQEPETAGCSALQAALAARMEDSPIHHWILQTERQEESDDLPPTREARLLDRLENGCGDYADLARVVLRLFDSSDRAPLSTQQTEALLTTLEHECPNG